MLAQETDEEPAPAAAGVPMRFGMDANSVSAQAAAGVKPDYGTMWLGPWTLTSGWGGPNSQLTSMRNAGVTPAIHFYYWGDDISQSCLKNGCYSSLHSAQKDQAGWQLLAEQMVDNLNARMGGEPVVIFMETEFNKADVQTWEPLDAMLEEKARFIKQGYPNAQIVLAIGNWNSPAWKTWDRAAAASDYVGIQGMRGSTRDSLSHYLNLYEASLSGARTLQGLFGKPVFLTDIALSSYPEPEYLGHQQSELKQFFDNLPALKDAGVEAMLYRGWRDNPTMNLANYYGQAERHWGLNYAYSTGAMKPSGHVWVAGVKDERAAMANVAPVARFQAAMTDMTVEVDARTSSDANGDALTYSWRFGDGSTATGATARRTYEAPGSYTVTLTVHDGRAQATTSRTVQAVLPNRPPAASFTATTTDLAVALDARASSDADGDALHFAWELGDGRTATGATVSHTYGTAGSYVVTLTVTDDRGASTTARTLVTVAPARVNQAPTAAFTATGRDLDVAVDGTASD
ncbi:MAG TPA: PKD domain-containing protein, partial [Egibacteraceae bacterium]|nr:PKD domain-containing protein [Egibacteraceae bacterium]